MEKIFEKLNRYFFGKWHLAVLDLKSGRWIKEYALSNIAYLKAQNANGRHILIQPKKNSAYYYLLVDDLSWPMILQHHRNHSGSWKPGRMVVETSPANYQVWIHSTRALSLDEKRYWLKRLNSDPGADPNNRWGRCPGFRNRKAKYCDAENRYPLARLIWIDWRTLADIPKPQLFKGHNSICRSDYLGDDESATDFAYAIALLRRGYGEDEVYRRLRNERDDWKNHLGARRMEQYLKRTINRAMRVVGQ